jgi:tyrosyl-tRNA synthetase
MSKTFGNFVAIEDTPENMYGKIMSIKDELIDHYFELATRLPIEEIAEIKKSSDKEKLDNILEILSKAFLDINRIINT